MQNQENRRAIIAAIGSMTQAQHAHRVLAMAAIHTKVIKTSSDQSHRGCTYGLLIAAEQGFTAERVLRNAGIRIISFSGGETL